MSTLWDYMSHHALLVSLIGPFCSQGGETVGVASWDLLLVARAFFFSLNRCDISLTLVERHSAAPNNLCITWGARGTGYRTQYCMTHRAWECVLCNVELFVSHGTQNIGTRGSTYISPPKVTIYCSPLHTSLLTSAPPSTFHFCTPHPQLTLYSPHPQLTSVDQAEDPNQYLHISLCKLYNMVSTLYYTTKCFYWNKHFLYI